MEVGIKVQRLKGYKVSENGGRRNEERIIDSIQTITFKLKTVSIEIRSSNVVVQPQMKPKLKVTKNMTSRQKIENDKKAICSCL